MAENPPRTWSQPSLPGLEVSALVVLNIYLDGPAGLAKLYIARLEGDENRVELSRTLELQLTELSDVACEILASSIDEIMGRLSPF